MSRWRVKHPRKSGTLSRSGCSRSAAMEERAVHLYDRVECGCRFCTSMRQVKGFDEIHRGLAEAAASGDETWYERMLKEGRALLQRKTP